MKFFFYFICFFAPACFAGSLTVTNISDISITYFAGICYSKTIGNGTSNWSSAWCGGTQEITLWQASGGANWGTELCGKWLNLNNNPSVVFSGSNGNYNCTWSGG